MLAFEHYPQSYHSQFTFDEEEIKQEHYLPNTMESYPFWNSMPLTADMFGNGQQDIKHGQADAAPSLNSSAYAPSIPSAASSTIGSPYSGHAQLVQNQILYADQYITGPTVVCDDSYSYGYETAHFDHEALMRQDAKLPVPFVDPVMISDHHLPFLPASYAAYQAPQQQTQYSPAVSPAPSSQSYHSFSQPVTVNNFGTQHAAMRRQSMSSLKSGSSPRSTCSADDASSEKGRCSYPDCGRFFKDLKAHMLTHATVRPEKCPIVSCEYNKKGFARKYDRNRHTLTHYRGNMVCGFCPGSGSAAERSFNRADVFKRHLTTAHGVEQTPPNSRKRSSSKSVNLSSYCQDATGKCSTCGLTFSNAQEFYEHLDDCVLKVVQQEDPSEAINAQRLGELVNDADLQATFERNHIKSEDNVLRMERDDDEEEDDEDEDDDEEAEEDQLEYKERCGRGVIRQAKTTSNRAVIGGKVFKKGSKKGLTWSRGGGAIIGKSRKRRKFYPPSWGMATDKMNMKKRVLCVYDGQRRLLKDDMMMHNEFEVRMPLQDSNSYVTDLDMETMKRADAFHNITAEEKGPWVQEQDFLREFLQ